MPTLPRIAAIVAIAVALAGCSALSPNTTQNNYSASDGIQVVVGDVLAHNVLMLTTAEGAPAALIASLTNRAGERRQVTITWEGGSGTVSLAGNATVLIGLEGGKEHIIGTAPVAPGLIADVSFATDQPGGDTAPVPVLDTTLPHYRAYAEQVGLLD